MITPAYAPTATERVLPRLALDFTTGVLDPRVTVTRALNTATRVNSSGSIEIVNANLPRFDYDFVTLAPKGLLIEETRANLLGNNTAVGAVVGSPGTLPTNWSAVLSGLSSQVVAVGTENGVDYVDIRFFGTLTGSNFLVYLQSSGGSVTTGANQPTTISSYLKIVAGSLANITTTRFVWDQFTSGGGYVTSSVMNTTLDATLTRRTGTATTAATTSRINPYIQFLSSVGAAIDITVRFGLPQVELGAFATSAIKTSSGSLTRNADVVSMTGTNFSDWYNASEGAFSVSYIASNATKNQNALWASNGTSSERMGVRGINSSSQTIIIGVAGGTTQWNAAINGQAVNALTNACWSYKVDSVAWARGGANAGSDTLAVIPTVNQLRIGADETGVNLLNGHVQKINYWPQRITNAETTAFSK